MERKAPRFLGQEVGEAEQALIREIVGTCGGLSRMELAAPIVREVHLAFDGTRIACSKRAAPK